MGRTLLLSGVEFGEVWQALVGSFNLDDFDIFLRIRLDFRRPKRVADDAFEVVVRKVLEIAEQEGWEAILIAEAAAERPLKKDLQLVYEKYAAALVDEFRRQAITDKRLEALERFGLGPRVTVQHAGAQQPTPANMTDEGFERVVRPHLGAVDLGLWREQMLRVEQHVCRVEVNRQGVGTGFLVGPDTLLTNYHVMKRAIEEGTAKVQVRFRFDFRMLKTGLRSTGTLVAPHATDWRIDFSKPTAGESANDPDATLPTADELDYALVRLERPFGNETLRPETPGSSVRGWIEVPAATPALGVGTPILIVQHPNGNPVALTIDTSGVQSVNTNITRVRYNTNTEHGSSGSPCFDLHWGLVALHHYGDPLNDRAQYNQGVPIEAIRARIGRTGHAASLGGPPPA
jgi:hypothetical protein